MATKRRAAAPRNATPRKHDAEATRGAIVAAATREFAARGFAGARVDVIAAGAGANKRMLYVYFGDKEGLYREVLRRHFARALELPALTLDPGADSRAQGEAVVRSYFWFLADNPEFVRLLGWEVLAEEKRARNVLLEMAGAGLESLRRIVVRGVELGELRAGLDPDEVMMSVNALCLGFFQLQPLLEALWHRDLGVREAREAVLEHLVGLLFDGIRADGAPAGGSRTPVGPAAGGLPRR